MYSDTIYLTVMAAVELALVGGTLYALNNLVGNPDNTNNLSKTLTPVVGILGAIITIHTLLWYMYFTHHPQGMNLYFLMSTMVSMLVSLTALSIALIQRS